MTLRDVRFALRSLCRSPGFTALAVLMLALGIGATTSVYSFVSGILLSRLPYDDPDSLVVVTRRNDVQGFRGLLLSTPDVAALREQSESFDFVSGFGTAQAHVGGDVDPERVGSASLPPGLLEQLGVEVVLGRGFSTDDTSAVLVSERLWRARLGGDASAIGSEILVDGAPRTIVGILPGASGLPLTEADVVLPLREDALSRAEAERERARNEFYYFRVIARLRSGRTIDSARAELESIQRRLEEENPVRVPGWGLEASSLKASVVGDAERTLVLLFGAVVVVLLIACINVANLMLARGLSRERELAVRAALGAGRVRILRQLMTESGLVCLAGGALGVLLAAAGHDFLIASSPPGVPRLGEVALDGDVLLFALALSVASGLLSGILPGLGLSRRALVASSARATDSRNWRRIRGGLTVFEAAMALALLVAAGLLTRSLVNLLDVDPGFTPMGTVSFGVSLPEFRFPEGEPQDAAVRNLLTELEALPDVEAAAASFWTPLSGAWGRAQVSIEAGSGSIAEREQWPIVLGVTPGFFRTLRIPLLAGRDFTERDRTSENGAVVITEALARAAWPNDPAVGRRLKFGGPGSDSPWLTVVGVVSDARLVGLRDAAGETMFLPFFGRGVATFQMLARTRGEPMDAMPSIREAIRSVDPAIPMSGVRTMDDLAAGNVASPRFYLYVVGLFAAGAVLLTAIGILGVVAHGVVQRKREMGIRMALGAARGDVLALVVRDGMALVLLGVALGLVLAFASTRLLGALLYEVAPIDALSFVAASLLLVGFGLMATLVPAWRAARTDPMDTLRAE